MTQTKLSGKTDGKLDGMCQREKQARSSGGEEGVLEGMTKGTSAGAQWVKLLAAKESTQERERAMGTPGRGGPFPGVKSRQASPQVKTGGL